MMQLRDPLSGGIGDSPVGQSTDARIGRATHDGHATERSHAR